MKRYFLFAYFLTSIVFGTVNAYKYELTLCAIFHNEASILKEWIEFHKIVGVEHFYLYNNNSTDNYLEVLTPYIEKGIVDVIDWKKTYTKRHDWWRVQVFAYMDCIEKVEGVTKWLAIVDCDEFLFPVMEERVQDVLVDYEDYGALAVNCLMYGTSGVYELNPKVPMISQLTRHLNCDNKFNGYVKCIVRPERTIVDREGWTSMNKEHWRPHRPFLRSPYIAVTENYVPVMKEKSGRFSAKRICINHYWTRDEKYLYEKKLRRPNKHKPKIDYDLLNEVYDTTILKYEEELTSALQGK